MSSLRVFAGFAGILLLPAIALARDDTAALRTVIEKQSPAIVSVRASLKTSFKGGGGNQDTESPMTMQGVVVSPNGLVMVSNLAFSPTRAMELFGGGRGMMDTSSMKVTPTSIKVHFGGDEKEYDGFLAATDTPLDLAFIQVEGLGDRKVPFVDFASTGTGGLGQAVYAVARLQKGYDYAPFAQTARVVGEIAKPRKAWLLEGSISNFGLPVYNAEGQPIGVLTTIVGGANDDAGAAEMSFSMFMRMMTGGGSGMGGAFVLPGNVVKGLVDQASKRAADLAVERAKKKPDAIGKTSAKPAEAKPGTGTTKPGTGTTRPAPKKP